MRFGCTLCDCPSVSVPSELHANALVTCSNCGEAIATWLEFKGCVTRVIASEPYYAPGSLSRASYDPLSAEASTTRPRRRAAMTRSCRDPAPTVGN